jgi:hypothetical protein
MMEVMEVMEVRAREVDALMTVARRRHCVMVEGITSITSITQITSIKKDGRGNRDRTRDLRFWRPSLYQLSYTPAREAAVYPR